MNSRFSLKNKSILLVTIPLIFELGLVCVFINLQQEAEIESRQALEARDISQRLSSIAGKIYKLWRTVEAQRRPDAPESMATSFLGIYKSQFLPVLSSVADDYTSLEKLTQGKPELLASCEQSKQSIAEVKSILNKGLVALNAGDVDYIASGYRSAVERIDFLAAELNRRNFDMIANAEHASTEMMSARHDAFRQNMLKLVQIVCFANAIFCVLLGLFFQKSIISRLALMRDNAQRLAAKQSLHNEVGGNDEIANLDHVFHKMVETIAESSQMRQELINMLAHDLRTPLTSIQGSLEMLDQKLEQASVEKRLVQLANRNRSRMMRLINDLLDIHRIEAGMLSFTPENVCLAALFEEAAADVSRWSSELGIKITLIDTELFVYAEHEKVERIVFNLIANAVRFSPVNGTVTISAKAEGQRVTICVAGQGVTSAAELQTIFERFQKNTDGENQSAGSGLGLTISQHLVRLMGGQIWVTSEPDTGSCFIFTLPLA